MSAKISGFTVFSAKAGVLQSINLLSVDTVPKRSRYCPKKDKSNLQPETGEKNRDKIRTKFLGSAQNYPAEECNKS